MSGPLEGLKVIEMAGLGPCPLAGQLLADLGADVTVIERAPGADRPADINNRNKRSVVINLKAPGASDLVLELIAQADVLMEGFRPGVMERLGIGPDECLARNPGLIYGRITGWGQEGPMANMAGHDLNYLAQTGMLYMMGSAGQPPSPPLNLVADYGGGTMFLLFGIFAALWERNRSGMGQVVDAAMIDGVTAISGIFGALKAQGQWSGDRESNLLDGGAPYYRTYQTSDGGFVAVGAIEPQFFEELVEKAGIPAELASIRDDSSKWPEQRAAYAEIFASRTRDEWAQIFKDSDACVVPVLTPEEAVTHPHSVAREMHVRVADTLQAVPAPRFSRSKPGTPRPPSPAGTDTHSFLEACGIDSERVSELVRKGIVPDKSCLQTGH